MTILKKKTDSILLILIIAVNSFVPLFVWPFGTDYFYYPKIIIIYILVILLVLVSVVSNKIRYRKIFSKELIPLLLFLFMVLLSAFLSPFGKQAFFGAYLRYEGALTYAAYFLILLFSYITVKSMYNAAVVIKYILLSGFLISSYAVLQYVGIEILPRDNIRKLWTFTSFATLGNPNFLGSYLSIILPVSVCLYFYEIRKKNKIILLIITVIIYAALVCSGTRSAWLGVLFTFIILTILFVRTVYREYNKLLLLLSICILVTYLLNGLHSGLISSRFNSIIDDYKKVVSNDKNKLNAGSQRIFIWSRTMNHILDRPFLGSGPDTFDKVFEMNSNEASTYFGSPAIYVDKAHNEYLQIIITMGFPALILYLYFIAILLFKSVSKIIRGNYIVYTVCLFSAVLSYSIQAFFNISVVSVAPLYWSVLGMLMAVNKINKNRLSSY